LDPDSARSRARRAARRCRPHPRTSLSGGRTGAEAWTPPATPPKPNAPSGARRRRRGYRFVRCSESRGCPGRINCPALPPVPATADGAAEGRDIIRGNRDCHPTPNTPRAPSEPTRARRTPP